MRIQKQFNKGRSWLIISWYKDRIKTTKFIYNSATDWLLYFGKLHIYVDTLPF